MPYTFIPADADAPKQHFADMAELRASFEPLFVSVNKSKQLIDVHDNVLGRVVWAKRPHNVENAPAMIQQDGNAPSLQDVLAEIDRLEAEETPLHPDDLDMLPDNEDDAEDLQPRQGAAERAGIPLLGENEGQQNASGLPYSREVTPRVRDYIEGRTSTRRPRMNHKACGHPITGEAGKIARAECRARTRAMIAAAS